MSTIDQTNSSVVVHPYLFEIITWYMRCLSMRAFDAGRDVVGWSSVWCETTLLRSDCVVTCGASKPWFNRVSR